MDSEFADKSNVSTILQYMDFKSYDPEGFYDELFEGLGKPRQGTRFLINKLDSLPPEEILRRQKAAEAALFNMGVTFTVYSDESGIEKIFPFDIIPRIINNKDWQTIEAGLKQRIYALNLFIDDVYHEQKIIKDGVVPEHLLYSGKCYLPQCEGLNPPNGVWCHITGTDLVRDRDGNFYVLEDNLRTPSGVSYVLENRLVLKRTFPGVFETSHILPVDDYPDRLVKMLQFLARGDGESARIGLLTPGIYNSAYFEHSFLAQQCGIELVQGSDLVVMDNQVFMRTTHGLEKIDVIYRRVDDTFLDPECFNPESMLGVPGIMEAYKAGNVALANAPGTGIADDKVVYAYVPKIIKYYTGEDAILPNVPTYVCWDDKEREYVLSNLDKLVVKAANESGGYGMLIGPHASESMRSEFAEYIKDNPRNYIAQPTISLSRVPVIVDDDRFEGRHVDLRPYILYGDDIYVMPGGLTRVALKKGSLVVNSSQGGGSKDTWVLSDGVGDGTGGGD